MSNMGYCRFENTYDDLRDCFDNWSERTLSESEERYQAALVKLCEQIAHYYGGDE